MTKQQKKHISLAGFLITVCGAILFSTKAIFVKLAFASDNVDAITLLVLRMLFSLPFYLVALFISTGKEKQKKLSNRDWLFIITLGLLGYYLSSLFDFIGLQYISAGLERLILFLYPTFAVLINAFFFKVRLSKSQLIALLLTYTGIGIAYWGEMKADAANPDFYFGSFMVFLCAVSYSFYLTGTGRIVVKSGSTRFTAIAMLAATAGVFTHFLTVKSSYTIHWTPSLISYAIALAIIATVLPSFLISNGMKQIGSNNVAIITSIGPVSTILQAHFILGEPMHTAQITGTVFVIIGVLLIGKKVKSKK